MTAKPSTYQRLPMILVAGVLSTGLVLSGCSNNDSVEPAGDTSIDTNETVAVTKSDDFDVKKDTEAAISNSDTTADTAGTGDVRYPTVVAEEQPSLVSNPTQTGSPEDTVKQALDTLYYGDVKAAAGYYKVNIPNFADELAKTQYAFQQTVDSVSITKTKYNDDKTRAIITGELMLKNQSEPAPLTYALEKIDGKWKILG